jgi:hypothetical protein
MVDNTDRIAHLNDVCRTAPGLGGRWVCTQGFAALDPKEQSELRELVERFNTWKSDNDPYGEHDFGRVESRAGTAVFWKISYYDKALQNHSPDPADASLTVRVLTLMLAEEY